MSKAEEELLEEWGRRDRDLAAAAMAVVAASLDRESESLEEAARLLTLAAQWPRLYMALVRLREALR